MFLLVLVTYGVYWFVWVYRSFSEVAASEGRDLHARRWLIALVVAFAPIVLLTLYLAASALANVVLTGTAAPADILASFETPNAPAPLVDLLPVPFLILQFFYLEKATRMTREISLREGDPRPPHPWLVAAFSGLGLLELVPRWGAAFLVAGLVVWALWKFQTQRAINRYWQRRAAVA